MHHKGSKKQEAHSIRCLHSHVLWIGIPHLWIHRFHHWHNIRPATPSAISDSKELNFSGQPTFIKYFDLATGNGTDLISTMNGLFQAGGVIGTLLLPTVADEWVENGLWLW